MNITRIIENKLYIRCRTYKFSTLLNSNYFSPSLIGTVIKSNFQFGLMNFEFKSTVQTYY